MIHQNVIKRRADEDGLPAPTVERDYVLAHVLTAISQPADLDFSLTGGVDAEGATRLVPEALVDCRERIGLPLLESDERNPPRIEYVGPLGAASCSACGAGISSTSTSSSW